MPTKPKQKTPAKQTDPVADLHQRLEALGYITSDRALVAECYALTMKAMTTTKAVPTMLLQGPPGTGKTFLAETMKKEWDAETFLFYQFAPGVTKEELLFDIDIANIATAQAGKWAGEFLPKHTVAPGLLAQALLASQKGRTILLLDELDKASEKVDAFLLDYLQNCQLVAGQLGVVKGNPRQLLVFITMNNQRQLSEPLMRRCRRHELGWPVREVEVQMVLKLATRELNQLARPPYPDLKIQLQAHAETLVDLANEVRGFAQQLKKVPSSPEIADALVDLAFLPNTGDWGAKAFKTLLAYPEDRKLAAKTIWRKSPTEVGGALVRAVTVARQKREEARALRKGAQGVKTSSPPAKAPEEPEPILAGRFYYRVRGDESEEWLGDLVRQGVLLRDMPVGIAARIVAWSRRERVPYRENYTTDGYDGCRTDLLLGYEEMRRLSVPLPNIYLPKRADKDAEDSVDPDDIPF